MYEVTEGDIEVSVCAVVRSPSSTCPVDFAFTINITTHSLTAGRLFEKLILCELISFLFISVPSEDYAEVNPALTFNSCAHRACVGIAINEDCHVESNEEFEVVMSRPEGLDSRIILSTESALVTINDNSLVAISLSDTVVIEEDSGIAEVCAVLTNENCPAIFPLELKFKTEFDSAGTYYTCAYIHLYHDLWKSYIHAEV